MLRRMYTRWAERQPGARATLRVPPRTPAFMNASSPAYVLACVFDNAMGLREPNAMYNSVLQSVHWDRFWC